MIDQDAIHLFSYGTLQLDALQRACFGPLLQGSDDSMPGFQKEMIEIADPDAVKNSGERYHPLVVPTDNPGDEVTGKVFGITSRELAAADAYEVSDYKRIKVTLTSGTSAWVYVKA
ncbi:MAG: gamma-glutamylcyclotransferase family protein [Phyllobacterium sp.]|uniref:gamma-glutamylcyclotransferase family protein n=1 Tax=Phyllobacterium sp. TaxID=1871046 RepID=UPI0030F2CF86